MRRVGFSLTHAVEEGFGDDVGQRVSSRGELQFVQTRSKAAFNASRLEPLNSLAFISGWIMRWQRLSGLHVPDTRGGGKRKRRGGEAWSLAAAVAPNYRSLMTVVLLLPVVASSQIFVCLMRPSASSRVLNAKGPICVTTSRSTGFVVVTVQCREVGFCTT
jgi:hypothetical protein